MKGRVVFWYRMRRHDDLIISETQFKLYGQQCKRCCKIRQVFSNRACPPFDCNVIDWIRLGFPWSIMVPRRNRECRPLFGLWSGQNVLRRWQTSSSTPCSPGKSEQRQSSRPDSLSGVCRRIVRYSLLIQLYGNFLIRLPNHFCSSMLW